MNILIIVIVVLYIYNIYLGLSELRKMYILNMYNLSFVNCNNSVNMEEKLQKHLWLNLILHVSNPVDCFCSVFCATYIHILFFSFHAIFILQVFIISFLIHFLVYICRFLKWSASCLPPFLLPGKGICCYTCFCPFSVHNLLLSFHTEETSDTFSWYNKTVHDLWPHSTFSDLTFHYSIL